MSREIEIQIVPGNNNGTRTYTVRSIMVNDDGTQTAVVIMDEQMNLAAVMSFLSTRITPSILSGNQVTVQLG